MTSIDTITKLAVSLSNGEFLVPKLRAVLHNGSGGVKAGQPCMGLPAFENRHVREEDAHSRLNGRPGATKRDQQVQSQDLYDPLSQLLVELVPELLWIVPRSDRAWRFRYRLSLSIRSADDPAERGDRDRKMTKKKYTRQSLELTMN